MLKADDLSEVVKELREDVILSMISDYIPFESLEEQWNIPALEQQIQLDFGLTIPIQEGWIRMKTLHDETLRHKILQTRRALSR